MFNENEIFQQIILGKLDKEDIKEQSKKYEYEIQPELIELNNLQLEQKEQIMKYQGITIHKNKNCITWYTRFRANGIQHYISGRTQKEVLDKLKKGLKQARIDEVALLTSKTTIQSPTLAEWYEKWLKLYKVGKVKESTLRAYKFELQHIPEHIQQKQLKLISLEELISTLNNCPGARQRQNLYDLLNMLYSKAVDNEIIEKNLVARIEKPKHDKHHGIALNNEQQTKLIEECNKLENGKVILIALYQGLRRGEVLGLTRDNIDFDNNTLTINKALNQFGEFDTTKNKQSIRTMPIFAESKKILLTFKNLKQSERVFALSTKQLERLIIKLRGLTKIEELKTKDLRSTFITRCKELNIPTHIIQAWVGHQLGSVVTNVVYTKHNADADNKYIDILNEAKFYSNSTHKK